MPTPTLGVSHVPVKVNFNITIDAKGEIEMFGEAPALVQNVIVAERALPVAALYDEGNETGLLEVWEPSDAQGDIKTQLANTDSSGNGQGGPDLSGAYQVACKAFAQGLQSVLCDAFDCSGVTPFSLPKYVNVTQYTMQRDFGRVVLAYYAHYLFGHVDATAAITNDVAFVQKMLSINAAGGDESADGPDNRAAAWTKTTTAPVESWDASGNEDDANLALRLVEAIVAKGKDAGGGFIISSVSTATADSLANIVKQVIGQDSSRMNSVDGSQRTRDQHQLLRFYANDIIYMNINVQPPIVSVANYDPNPDNVANPPAASNVSAKSFTLKIRLTDGDKFIYTDATKTVISGYDGTVPTTLTIPSTVTAIADDAFLNATRLVTVNLPAGLLSIGARAFKGCTSLTTIEIPSSVLTIGESAFEGCTSLASAYLPGTGTKSIPLQKTLIGTLTPTSTIPLRLMRNRTIIQPTITNTYVPKTTSKSSDSTLTRLSKRVRQLSRSTFMVIPLNLFKGCASLATVQIPPTVLTIKASAFESCGGLTTITLPPSITSIETAAFKAVGLTSITLPASLTSIAPNTFQNSANLAVVEFPDNLQTIGSGAFEGCENLTTVVLNDGLQTIEANAFKNTPSLEVITLPPTLTTIRAAAFQGSGLTSITVPSSVTTLESAVFANTPNLTSAVIEANVSVLPAAIFANAVSLTAVTLPPTITTIASEALRNTSITTFTNTNVQTIEANAFADIPVLSVVSVPALQILETGAFSGSTSLTAPPTAPPSAPINLVATPGDQSVQITFTEGSDGGSAITNYKYSINGGSTFTAFSPAQTATSFTITGLTNGTAYSIQLRAVNTVGDGVASAPVTATPRTVPVAPTSLVATPGNQSVQLAFTAGSNGGSAITNYKYSINGGSTFTAFSPAQTTSPVTITGLTNGTTYNIQLKAVNAAGDGTASDTVTAIPCTVPGAPTSLVATPGDQSVQVAFTAGSNGGSAITNYKYSINGGSTFTAFSPAQTTSPVTITGLANGTTYSIQLKAVNAAGDGAASTTVIASLQATPSAPTDLVATPGDQSVQVAFTAGSSGGSAITNYKYSIDGGSTFTAFSPAQTASPVTITGLTNGTSYSIQLKAVNMAGDSAASSTASATPRTVPAAPTNLIATPGDQSVQVAFTAGSNGGSVITNYKYSIDGGSTFIAFSPAQTTSPVTITGLTNGTTYNIQLKAVNAAGDGATSEFVPSDISGLNLWLDASQLTGLTNGQALTSWVDKSINTYTGTAVAGPTYQTNALNSKPVVRFNGSSQYINFGNKLNIGTAQGISIFSVFKYTGGNGTVIAKSVYGAGEGRWAILREGEMILLLPDTGGGAKVTSFADSTTSYQMIGGLWDRSSQTIYQNGTAKNATVNTLSTNSTNSFPLYVGAYGNTDGTAPQSGLYLSGDIAETIVYLAPLTTAERQRVEGYLAWKWGLQSTLPSSHPYKSANLTVSATPASAPSAPTNLSATGGNEIAEITFTAGSNGGSAITNYKYSINGGATFTAFSPAQTTSPVTITGLTNGTTYSIQLKAVNAIGDGAASATVSATPIFIFTPRGLTSLNLWLDATQVTGYTSGQAMTSWVDKSVNAYANTGYNGPTYQTSALNSLPTVRFNGTSQYFNFGNVLNLQASGLSIFAIANIQTSGNLSVIAKSVAGPGFGRWGLIRDAGNMVFLLQTNSAAVNISYADSTTGSRLLEVLWDRSTVTNYRDAVLRASGSATEAGTLTNTFPLYVGAYPDGAGTGTLPGFFMNGDIAEILVYSRALSTDDRQMVEGYLSWKWGLQGNLPLAHPYKYTNPAVQYTTSMIVPEGLLINFTASSYSGSGAWINAGALGTGYNATITAGRTPAKNAAGNGIVFNGSSGWTFANIGRQTSFTISSWVKRTAITPDYVGVVADGADGGGQMNMAIMGTHPGIPIANTDVRGGFYDGTAWRSGSSVTLTTNTWIHVTATFDNTTKNLMTYVNGALVNTTQYAGLTPNTNARLYRIGQHIAGEANYFTGEIGQVLIYNRAITSTEALQNYNATASTYSV